MRPCSCSQVHTRRRVVLTGGPGAGKTAVLELVRQQFCRHVRVLPEAAGIVFGGGFPRTGSLGFRRSAQRAIFAVQRELEHLGESNNSAVVLCDRGTVDGAAYWPGPDDFWTAVGTAREAEMSRYDAVIHLRTPSGGTYTNGNPIRTETAEAAAEIDTQLLHVGHPHRFVVPPSPEYFDKPMQTIEVLCREIPECCNGGVL